MVVFPKAKINLGLRVTGRRSDGFHDIETIFYPVSLCDALEFVTAADGTGKDILTITGISTGGLPEDNLVLKAVKKLRQEYRFPHLIIHLHKAIPSGAGLGGGSSDAACMLKTVNRVFGLGLSNADLKRLALSLGSDCPFFIDALPAFAGGRGELLTPVSAILDGFHIVIANPGIAISTMEAYNNCIPGKPQNNLAELVKAPVSEWKDLIINDFEAYVFSKYPVVAHTKQAFYRSGALFSSLSGSGSSVYGIFSERPGIKGKLADYIIYEGKL